METPSGPARGRRLFRWERHEVLKHEHFEEICAAASIGHATPEELLELERHVADCGPCRRAYFEYLNIAAQQFAAANENPTLSAQEAKESLNSELFTRRFFERAEREGIQFSIAVGEEVRQLPPPSPPPAWQRSRRMPVSAIAAVALIAVGLSAGYFYGRGSLARGPQGARTDSTSVLQPPVAGLDQRIAELTAANSALEEEIDGVTAELGRAKNELGASQATLGVSAQDREKLQSDRNALEAKLESVQRELAESEKAAANAQQEAAKLQDRSSASEAALVADQVKIQDLTEELSDKSALLDQERQLLALGHDVSDLMGARNLHIVDVVDTDPRGKTRPAFGRVFFTEGRSLVFYAYDLSDAKVQKSSYQYRVWAKQEGGDKQVRNLGIFYSDDKAQRRWVFKCNDPKILNEIDSVFVTLEPAGSDPSRPQGQNLMYAYLRGQPNHP
jgi:hypothetical protein